LQSIDLTVAAEELGADGAYFRVHHFARQLASPFPLLAAVGPVHVSVPSDVIAQPPYDEQLCLVVDAPAIPLCRTRPYRLRLMTIN
jgi:hypothetical protein